MVLSLFLSYGTNNWYKGSADEEILYFYNYYAYLDLSKPKTYFQLLAGALEIACEIISVLLMNLCNKVSKDFQVEWPPKIPTLKNIFMILNTREMEGVTFILIQIFKSFIEII